MDRHDRRTVHPSAETPPFADPLPDASAVLPGEREDSSLAPPEIERADECRRGRRSPRRSRWPTRRSR